MIINILVVGPEYPELHCLDTGGDLFVKQFVTHGPRSSSRNVRILGPAKAPGGQAFIPFFSLDLTVLGSEEEFRASRMCQVNST